MIKTVWPVKPKIFAIWTFVESLLTCGLERQGGDLGMKTEMMKGVQRHGLRGEGYQREGGSKPWDTKNRGEGLREETASE